MIDILDANFHIVDILRKYDFAQFEIKAREIGEFQIKVPIEDDVLYLLDKTKQYYVLFNEKYFGKITSVKRDSDSEYERTIEIKGLMSMALLNQRVIKGTLNFKGKTYQYVRELIYQNITKDVGTERYVDIGISYENETHLSQICSQIEKQVTGGYVFDEVQTVLEQDSLGIIFNPVVQTASISDNEVSVEEWEMKITHGIDRRMGNTDGNEAIVFSQSLSNINRTTYERNTEKYKSVAYVAGEGEEQDRKWFEVYHSSGDDAKIGWNRNELWVDARDIQSEQDGEELTEDEYEQQIVNRANEKFADNDTEESYECTVVQDDRRYIFEEDYDICDWCTVEDDELGITVDAQITGVTISSDGGESGDIIDIELTYGKTKVDPINKISKQSQQVENNSNNIKYLENALASSMSEVVQNIYLAIHPVGDIVFNTTGVNPGTLYGGTWVAWGAGRVPVGFDGDDSAFNTSEKEGGSRYIQAHTHGISLTTASAGNHSHRVVGIDGTNVSQNTTLNRYTMASGATTGLNGAAQANGAHTHKINGDTESAGSGNQNNLQPYIVCYMWKRTA